MRVQYKKQFIKQLVKLPARVQEQFYTRLNLFLEDKFNPILNNHWVDNAYPGCCSINVTGDYRAIFYEQNDIAIFTKIGTHSELYG